jgi:hypothetical protein
MPGLLLASCKIAKPLSDQSYEMGECVLPDSSMTEDQPPSPWRLSEFVTEKLTSATDQSVW